MGIFSARIKKYHWDWNLQNLLKTRFLGSDLDPRACELLPLPLGYRNFSIKLIKLLDVFEKSFTSCNTYWHHVTKGQIISKWFLMSSISSKKQTKEFNFTTMIPQIDLFSFVFWRKSKTPKKHFKIIWPLIPSGFFDWVA